MALKRRKTRTVKIRNVLLGHQYPVVIQSMLKVKTSDVKKALRQIAELKDAGCQVVRLAIKDSADARALKEVRRGTSMPLVADIHFDYRLALAAVDNGADKIRLNPGNIYKKEQIREVIAALKSAGRPLRIGLNSGSVKGTNSRMDEKLVKSAMEYLRIIEGFGFYDTVISLKASTVLDTVSAYRKMAKLCDYPLHLGVTATGSPFSGAIKSSIALSALLLDGIGDTIRVSLTDKPAQEVYVAKIILESLGLRSFGPEIISCPTCGRCEVNLVKAVRDLEGRISQSPMQKKIKVAVMGCMVNGPGEAKEADVGIAFGRKEGMLFKKGKPVKKVSYSQCNDMIMKELLK